MRKGDRILYCAGSLAERYADELDLRAGLDLPTPPAGRPRRTHPRSGSVRGLHLVDFPDLPRHGSSTVDAFLDRFFRDDGGYDDGGTFSAADSVREYFLEASYGAFEVAGDADGDGVPDAVRNWRTLPRTVPAYFDPNPSAPVLEFQQLVRDALEAHDGSVDFRRFDNDGPDGVPGSGDDDGHVTGR